MISIPNLGMAQTTKIEYSNPEVLVDTQWVEEHLDDPTLRIVEVDYDSQANYHLGHIPGAQNIPWAQVLNDDGTFKSAKELSDIYLSKEILPSNEVITYCRIGERSSHSWFVLKYLLGYPDVKNYDGSWTEWGNLIGIPIEKEIILEAKTPTSPTR